MPPGEPDPAASVVSGPAEGEFDTEDDGEQRQGSLAFENLDAIGALASIVGAHGLTRNSVTSCSPRRISYSRNSGAPCSS